MADSLLDLYTAKRQEIPELGQIHKYLMDSGNDLGMRYYNLKSGTLGQYGQGVVELDPNQTGYGTRAASNVLTHELTHALDDQMNTQSIWQKNKNPESRQFAEAYDKLDPRAALESQIAYERQLPGIKHNVRTNQLETMYNDRSPRDNRLYRGTSPELRAHAVGDVTVPMSKTYLEDRGLPEPPSHYNATLATENAILRDMSLRARKAPASPGFVEHHINQIRNLFSRQ